MTTYDVSRETAEIIAILAQSAEAFAAGAATLNNVGYSNITLRDASSRAAVIACALMESMQEPRENVDAGA